MENISKAIDMAGGILLFIVATTVSVILYNQIIEFSKKNFLISDLNSSTELAIDRNENYEQVVSTADVIMSLININNLGVSKVVINNSDGYSFNYKPVIDEHLSGYEYIEKNGDKYKISTYNFKQIEPHENTKYATSYKNQGTVSTLTFNAIDDL
jgi:hypothetical protein